MMMCNTAHVFFCRTCHHARTHTGAAVVAAAASSAAAHHELLRRAEAAELALATIQRAHTEAVERCATQREEHNRALLRLREEAERDAESRWRQRVAAAEAGVTAAHAKCGALEAALADARSTADMARLLPPSAGAVVGESGGLVGVRNAAGGRAPGWSPGAEEFLVLERRLEAMSREAVLREARWREVLRDTQALHGLQLAVAGQRLQASEQQQQTQLAGLRARVDELLSAAEAQMGAASGSGGGGGRGLGKGGSRMAA
jgi:hypothetical protein